MSGIVSQPGVSLRVSLGLSLSGGLSLLYGHDGIVLSSGGSSRSHSERGEGRENSVSARDEGSLIVPAAGSSGVDKRNVVVGEGSVVVHQRSVSHGVDKSWISFGLGLSIGSHG